MKRGTNKHKLTVVLAALLDIGEHLGAEARDATQLLDLSRRVDDAVQEAEVLSDGPGSAAGDFVALIVLDQMFCALDITGDGLLGEDMLASSQSGLNVLGLLGDGEGDDDRIDVGAQEEIMVGLAHAGVVRVEIN